MTLQEALKTELPMRRPCYADDKWVIVDNNYPSPLFVWEDTKGIKPTGPSDILADDWEVKDEKFTLSEQDIRNWLEASLCGRRYSIFPYMGKELEWPEFIDALIKDLKWNNI